MYSSIKIAFKYLNYYLAASNGKGHGIHSPFVFEFVTKVLNDRTNYPAYEEIEDLRQRLLSDRSVLNIDDLGAGSAISKTNQRSIASIARNAVKSKKFGQLFYRIAKFYQPRTILELGTSLGITTSYLAKANEAAKVISLEGAKEIVTVAQGNFTRLRINNVETRTGNFDDTLLSAIKQLEPSINLAFIDGNHRLQPTIRYLNTIIPKTDNSSIVILDDIHWSSEMEEAWEYCKDHSAVTLSIDLFFIGILIFRKEIREKQHFIVRF